MLTDKQTVDFLKIIKSGRNTYGELKKIFPLERRDWFLYIDDGFNFNPVPDRYKIGIIEFVDVPHPFFHDYEFKDTDTFKLTVAGQNILDRDKKERTEHWLTAIAAAGGAIAIIEFILKSCGKCG